jgi:hypothetical protein
MSQHTKKARTDSAEYVWENDEQDVTTVGPKNGVSGAQDAKSDSGSPSPFAASTGGDDDGGGGGSAAATGSPAPDEESATATDSGTGIGSLRQATESTVDPDG